MLLLFFPGAGSALLKAYVHGHYRLLPKTGKRIWIESHTDKRPERHRASFENTVHRVTHVQHHLAMGRTREALHAFHDLNHEDAHQLARHLGLAGDEKGKDKKALMESMHERLMAKRRELQTSMGKEAAAKERAEKQGRRAAYAALVESAVSESDPKQTLTYRKVSPREADAILRQSGLDVSGLMHEFSAEALRHALRKHGDQEKEAMRQPPQRALTKQDLLRLPEVLDNYDSIEVQARGQNRTSILYRKRFPDGETVYVERAIETSAKNKPRLTTKSAWVVAATGVKPSPAPVSTRDRIKSVDHAGTSGKVRRDVRAESAPPRDVAAAGRGGAEGDGTPPLAQRSDHEISARLKANWDAKTPEEKSAWHEKQAEPARSVRTLMAQVRERGDTPDQMRAQARMYRDAAVDAEQEAKKSRTKAAARKVLNLKAETRRAMADALDQEAENKQETKPAPAAPIEFRLADGRKVTATKGEWDATVAKLAKDWEEWTPGARNDLVKYAGLASARLGPKRERLHSKTWDELSRANGITRELVIATLAKRAEDAASKPAPAAHRATEKPETEYDLGSGANVSEYRIGRKKDVGVKVRKYANGTYRAQVTHDKMRTTTKPVSDPFDALMHVAERLGPGSGPLPLPEVRRTLKHHAGDDVFDIRGR